MRNYGRRAPISLLDSARMRSFCLPCWLRRSESADLILNQLVFRVNRIRVNRIADVPIPLPDCQIIKSEVGRSVTWRSEKPVALFVPFVVISYWYLNFSRFFLFSGYLQRLSTQADARHRIVIIFVSIDVSNCIPSSEMASGSSVQ